MHGTIKTSYRLCLLFAVFIATFLCATSAFAASMHIDIDGDNAKHRTCYVGHTRDDFKIKISSGESITQATWTSSDSSVLTISRDAKGAILYGVKEGAVRITLTVKTASNETLVDTCAVSVPSEIPEAEGILNTNARLSLVAWSDSDGYRTTAPKGQKLTIHHQSTNYYYVTLPDDFVFSDTTFQSAYVLKSEVDVPVTGVTLNTTSLTLAPKQTAQLKANITPSYATNKTLIWKSLNSTVASIDANGVVRAKKAGSIPITVTSANGKTAQVSVTVGDVSSSLSAANTPTFQLRLNTTGYTGKKLFNKIGYYRIPKASYYKVQRSVKKTTAYKDLKAISSNANGWASYTDKTAKRNKTYYYKVIAYKKKGGTRIASKTLAITTGKTYNLNASASLDRQIKLTWKKTTSVSGYYLYRSLKYGSGYTKIKTLSGAGKLTWTDTNLKANTTYYYKVVAYKTIKKKTSTLKASNIANAKTITFNITKNNKYFIKKVSSDWPGIALGKTVDMTQY